MALRTENRLLMLLTTIGTSGDVAWVARLTSSPRHPTGGVQITPRDRRVHVRIWNDLLGKSEDRAALLEAAGGALACRPLTKVRIRGAASS